MIQPATDTAAQADAWLSVYGALRPHESTHWREWASILITVSGLVGLLWALPVPRNLAESSLLLNWATLFLMAAVVYYFVLSIGLALGSLPLIVLIALFAFWLEGLPGPAWPVAATLLSAGIVWDLIELRRVNLATRPLPLLSHLMLGPPWLIAGLFRRVGLPY
jgi:hypothetical protein